MVPWLGLPASIAGGTGLIPGRGTKIPQAVWWGQKKKKPQPTICYLQKTHIKYKDTYRLKVNGWGKRYHANINRKKATVAVLISSEQGKLLGIKREVM